MERPWIKSYPPGVPADIDLAAYGSIRDILEKSCSRFADLPAFTCMGATITYRELDRLSTDFGSWLQNVAGLGKGARVALMMPNLLQYPVAIFGLLRAGPRRRQLQPAVHAARARAPAERLGRRGDRHPRELRARRWRR